MNLVEQVLYHHGIADSYINYYGHNTQIDLPTRQNLLKSCGVEPCNEQQLHDELFELDVKSWTCLSDHYQILTEGQKQKCSVKIAPFNLSTEVNWRISSADQCIHSGSFNPENLRETGHFYIQSERYTRREFDVPTLQVGYYKLEFQQGSVVQNCDLLVSPKCAYSIASLEKSKIWGISVQLYAMKSMHQWGVGDYSDLRELIVRSATHGCDAIVLNPLHLPVMDQPELASPYSPSDRLLLNPIYINPELCEDFIQFNKGEYADSEAIKSSWRKQQNHIKAQKNINYTEVWALKMDVFRKMYAMFNNAECTSRSCRTQQFQQFREQLINNSDIAQLPGETEQENDFQLYLQWIAHTQLEACQQLAKSVGMEIGLIRDLAVGSVKQGLEVTTQPGLYADGVSVGAPPDPWAEAGQSWGLPAPKPTEVRRSAAKHFRALLRENLKSCGALRIDHVMAIFRLWWQLPEGTGGYVYYPFDLMSAVLKIESHLAQVLIIGEDLGVVPYQVRMLMQESKIFSNNLFYFNNHLDGALFSPQEYPKYSMSMLTNHDVAPLACWWQAEDIKIRHELGLSVRPLQQLFDERNELKKKVLDWLNAFSGKHFDESILQQDFDYSLLRSIVCVFSSSSAALVTFQLEDFELNRLPINLPGTDKEYPNWRRRLNSSVTELLYDDSLFEAINEARGNN